MQQELHNLKAQHRLLFVCTINRMRSATAQVVFESDERFDVLSAGTDPVAKVVVTRELLEWADAIIVMEPHHRNKIRSRFPDIYTNKRIVCLYIPDEFEFMDTELIKLLKVKVNDIWGRGLLGF